MPRSLIDLVEKHHRRSVRLPGFDYRRSGMYFVTICAKNRECLFGEIQNDNIVLNECGTIALDCWNAIPKHFPHVRLDAFVIMPNHMHGILHISSYPHACRGTPWRAPTERKFAQSIAGSLSTIVNHFKGAVTRKMRTLYPTWDSSVWQRNYHERIIRNPCELRQCTEYIVENPKNWEKDEENV